MAETIILVMPALNEEKALAYLLPEIPVYIDHILVANNGSSDATRKVALSMGAEVVEVPQPGYGRACLAGFQHARQLGADIIVFMDADRSDFPRQMRQLLQPILDDEMDMVIGSRILGNRTKGALTPQQYFGNSLACALMRWFWGFRYSDLGPFRAIRVASLAELDMQELTFGWTVEMQIKAIQHGLKVTEVAVDYRPRIGVSKISGTVKGVALAGYYILTTIARAAAREKWIKLRSKICQKYRAYRQLP